MRTNGTYQFLIAESSEPRFDDFGNPLPDVEQWSEPMPCLIQSNSNPAIVTYADGQWVKASFIVFIEGDFFPHQRIRLQQKGREMGEYPIPAPMYADTMGRIKIVV